MPSINTNIAAYYAQQNLRTSSAAASDSIARLSSGNAIVRASDNVAGLAIGTVLKTDVSTLTTASQNASQASSLLQVADGSVSSLSQILQRQKALSVQANSGTLSDTERGYLDQEFQQLTTEYNQIVTTTNFNGVNLLDGSISGSSNITSGASSAQTFSGLPTSGNTVNTATLGGTYNNQVVGSQSGAIVTISDTAGTGVSDIVSVTLNGQTFTSNATDLHAAGASTITLHNGAATLTIATVAGTGATVGQTAATALAKSIQSDLSGTTVTQTRAVATTGTGSISSTTFDGTILQGVTGSSFVLKSDAFNANGTSAPSISSFSVSPYSASANGKISVNIGGDVYSATLSSSTIAASGTVTFTDETNSNNTLTFTNGANAINVNSAAGASELQTTLNNGFGTGSTGGLNFQVGVGSADSIGVSIANLNSSSVYLDDTGASQTLSISTQAGAQSASDVLDNAISTLTTATANVGALEERFNYASDTLSTAIQNFDAARGGFLDTDISAESTKYATEQVQQQAAISVLAQANQLPQNLLKLIGQ